MNNYVPMNMIPFIAKMNNASKVKPEPSPAPINPHDLLNKVVTLDFGEAYKTSVYGEDVYMLPIDAEQFMRIRNMAEEVRTNLPSFKLRFEGKDYVIISYESLGDTSLDNLVDIDMDDASMTEHNTFDYIVQETDSETGDSWVVLHLKNE